MVVEPWYPFSNNIRQLQTADSGGKESVERLQEIQNLGDSTRKTLFSIIDTFVRDAKARVAYQ